MSEAFRHEVLSMLKKEGKIIPPLVRRDGFHVHIGERIWAEDQPRHRRGFSQERMVYIPVGESTDGAAKVIYTSKDGRTRKTFEAMDWLAIS